MGLAAAVMARACCKQQQQGKFNALLLFCFSGTLHSRKLCSERRQAMQAANSIEHLLGEVYYCDTVRLQRNWSLCTSAARRYCKAWKDTFVKVESRGIRWREGAVWAYITYLYLDSRNNTIKRGIEERAIICPEEDK